MQANIKAILLAVSLIGASATAFANPVIQGGDQSPSADIETYHFAHEGFGTDGAFTHWLPFDVEGYRNLSADISGNASGGNTFSLTGFDLFTSRDELGNGVGLITNGEVNGLFGKIAFGGLNADVSGPATYWLRISGNSNTLGNTLAIYSGNITAAVPEPSTYGMLALGLGLIGFAARGRSKFSA
ncbi:FxDxF family PEP-CTERM protein [Methylobacillus sp.]|uniref:FxDxF family PEP-CTERM protein n=1 Tax=Methylobacillus sp. TaxID=56818 RepID=UPI002FE30106